MRIGEANSKLLLLITFWRSLRVWVRVNKLNLSVFWGRRQKKKMKVFCLRREIRRNCGMGLMNLRLYPEVGRSSTMIIRKEEWCKAIVTKTISKRHNKLSIRTPYMRNPPKKATDTITQTNTKRPAFQMSHPVRKPMNTVTHPGWEWIHSTCLKIK